MQIQPVTADIADGLGLKEAKGALVAGLAGDSPAGKAGREDRRRDPLGQRPEHRRCQGIVARHRRHEARREGERSSVWRDGQKRPIDVTIAKFPAEKVASAAPASDDGASAGSKLGLTLAPASEVGRGQKGVAITRVDPDSPAAEKGLQPGDVITLAAGKTVSTPDDVRKAVADAKRDGRKAVLLADRERTATAISSRCPSSAEDFEFGVPAVHPVAPATAGATEHGGLGPPSPPLPFLSLVNSGNRHYFS